MDFLGIDFGWTSQPSGVAALSLHGPKLQVEETRLIADAAAVPRWVTAHVGSGPVMVAIDAPTIIRNPSGMRPVEKLMHRHFGRQHAGCYPSNLMSVFASRTLALSRALERADIRHASQIEVQVPGRYQIEVHPHAATLHLLGLDRILKYKKGPLAQRRAGLQSYQELLFQRLAMLEPALEPLPPGELPSRGRELKAVEDQTDAILAAYIGAWWWYWGRERTLVLGDEQSGFIVVPVARDSALLANS